MFELLKKIYYKYIIHNILSLNNILKFLLFCYLDLKKTYDIIYDIKIFTSGYKIFFERKIKI